MPGAHPTPSRGKDRSLPAEACLWLHGSSSLDSPSLNFLTHSFCLLSQAALILIAIGRANKGLFLPGSKRGMENREEKKYANS